MHFLKKLANPFALVAEGFVVGAILFMTATPSLTAPHPAAPAALDSSVIPSESR